MSKAKIFWGFIRFLGTNKKWWMLPIVIMFVLLGLLIFLTQSPAGAPFIYTLF